VPHEQVIHPEYPRLKLQLRKRSRFWQALTFLDGRKVQHSLKTADPALALRLAASWYKKLLRTSVTESRQHPLDRLAADPTVGELFASFRLTLTKDHRAYCDTKWGAISFFWRPVAVTDITPQRWRDFYTARRKQRTQYGDPPANGTLHKDATLIGQILGFAVQEGHIPTRPPMLRPGRISKNPRPWLTPDEWQHLVKTGENRVVTAASERTLLQRLDLLEFCQAMVGTMCRVGELLNLRYRDCRIERTGKKNRPSALVAQVTGKRGTRTLVAPAEAAITISSRQERLNASPDDLVFPVHHRDGFHELLVAAGLDVNAQGYTRNLKSLRCTGISFRILESKNPNLLMIARNAGTSVAQIDDFYCKRLSAEMWKDDLSTSLRVAGDTLT
jgi:integrase